MNDTKIASKAKAQLAHFMGKVFTHFSKPAKKFITAAKAIAEKPETETTQLLPGFAELFDIDDG